MDVDEESDQALLTTTLFAVLILIFAILGVVVNVVCLTALRRHVSNFHRFIRALAIFDLTVILCCVWMYSMPVLSQQFNQHVFLPTVPFVLPLVQMSLLASVYCTVVLSSERYLRLCRFQIMSAQTASKCLVFVVVFAALFYLPKFWELRYERFVGVEREHINCSSYVRELQRLRFIDELDWAKLSRVESEGKSRKELDFQQDHRFHPACANFSFEADIANDNYIRTIEVRHVFHYPNATALRQNRYYYMGYCVGLNALVASFVPLVALAFFNLSTLRALKRVGRETLRPCSSSAALSSRSCVEMANLSGFRTGVSEALAAAAGSEPERSSVGTVSRMDQLWHESVLGHERLMRKKENRLTRISIGIVWLFIFCHVWKLVPTIYELIHSKDGFPLSVWPQWLTIVKHVSHALITFNSAVNFLIYTIL